MCMANLTLRIEDSLLAEARKLAASRETTVNNMVREFLTEESKLSEKEQAHEMLLDGLFAAFDDCNAHGRVPKLNREELHER